MKSLITPLLACLLVELLCAVPASAQPGQENNPLSWDRNIRGLFSRYCYRCHSSDDPAAGIDLAQDEDPRMILNHRDTWETVQIVLDDQSMPPDDAKQPSAEDRQLMLDFLRETLSSVDCESVDDPGPPPLRPLNRVEYDNAILDLTGLGLSIAAETFPADVSSYGFDNIGSALAMTPVQVQQYYAAAQRVIEEIVAGKQSTPELYERLIGTLEAPEEEELRDRMRRFSDAAFRRPASDRWIDRLTGLYQQSRASGEKHETAMGLVITAVLMAPQFLMRIEHNQLDHEGPYPVDDYELASRISYFLWSRGPDDQLLALASNGQLSQPDLLQKQVERMLVDSRSQALVGNFFGQWLGLRSVLTHEVDVDVFPEFDAELRNAMVGEVEAFLSELIYKNRPIHDLLDCNYGYLNGRLARHYGLSIHGFSEDEFRRIEFPDRRRGGVLTTAALLFSQSDPNRTNIPRRGNYIADRILGDPPPAPPPDVPQLEAAGDGRQVTLRELFEKHREAAACAGCHARIDPFGFALENYDALGRWRDEEAGQVIDPSGKLLDGQELDGPESLKDFLVESRQAFTRSLAKNLLIYALGRGLIDADRCILDSIVQADQNHPLRFSELVWKIVNSRPFLYRRNPEF